MQGLKPMHGYGIGLRLEEISRGVCRVHAGSLFPTLRRLEPDGLIVGTWQVTDNNRRGQYCALTTQGRATVKRATRGWAQQAAAIARVLPAAPGETQCVG